MNDETRDRSTGDAKQTEGHAKEVVGKALGNKSMETEGVAEKASGRIDNAANEGKARLEDAKHS
jgi:uncharacterized protein YjbJ (UPF0337 family)